MNKKITKVWWAIAVYLTTLFPSFAQDFSNSEYDKALWMTTRFYGAQRSGDYNWTILDHPEAYGTGTSFANDNDGGYDLSGGWFDCGDHVKFGQTQYYAGYMILKAYAEFPEGFDDYYSADYSGYDAAGNWTWESGAGQPNGIPDMLDEVKHATDYFIKCARSSTQFYYEVGNGNYDHAEWVTSAHMQNNPVNTGGEPRPSYKNPNDAAMASFCSATLALMSRMYRDFDPTYADLCLQHAKYAYDYAQAHPGAVGAASGSFYGPNDNWKNAWAIANAEMYLATNNNSYLSTALGLNTDSNNGGDVHPNAGYTFDYSNNGELALYVLAQIGHPDALADFNTRMTNHWLSGGNYNGEGAYNKGGGWGKLRYVGNAAYLIALYDKINGNGNLNARFYDNIDYILGSNNANFSFIVGFGNNHPKYPHHRNAYLRDDNPGNSAVIQVNPRNSQLGALVGGSLSSGSYNDERNDYVNSEVCIDYNAGITGALGALKAKLNPIDPNKFLSQCASPGDLGGDQTLCGAGSVTLNTGLGTKTNRTFQWYRNDVPQGGPSSTQTSLSVTQAGVWKVVVDSAGECQRSSSVTISGTLGTVNLGSDIELCDPATATLDAGISGSVSYTWTKDGSNFASSKTINVTEAGTYAVTVSASGCPSVGDNINVTSLLPEVENDTICAAGQATLQVTSAGGPFDWYTSAGASTPTFTGNPFTPNITGTTTYYVADGGSFAGNVGPTTMLSGAQNWGVSSGNHLIFQPLSNFTIDALKVQYGTIYSNDAAATITIEVLDQNGNAFSPAKTFTSNPTNVTTAMSNSLIRFTFTGFDIDMSWGTSLRLRVSAHSINGQLLWTQSGASYPYNSNPSGIVNITGTSGGNGDNNDYMYFYDWEVSSGVSCAKKPVIAVLDPGYSNCGPTDTDNDGTPDNSDACPNDPNKAASVGQCGCGVADTDSDGDGVADCNDVCALGDDNEDLDTDGIPDACDNDIDGDGVNNASDCDPLNALITTGQTFYADTDNDGFGDPANSTTACTAPAGYVSNNSDNCPSDMNKQNPGTCGCGVADTDSDGDGVADCNDVCALGDDNDDLDTDGIPDACDNDIDGDGVDNASDCAPMNASITTGQTFYADTDNDGFGDPANSTTACTAPAGYVSNNSDNCPSDMNKQNPGTCGCGVADTDSDADGVADCNDICALGDDNVDLDTDGIPDACDNDIDGDGVDNASDCDPMNASITTGTIYYLDADGDTYGDENDAGAAFCSNPGAGYSTNNLDCDDANSGKNPGATEIPGNGIDEDCDGSDAIMDTDNDGIPNNADNCPTVSNAGQEDDDADGVGNVCDICALGDDNADLDTDGTPDACDNDIDGDGIDNASDCDPMNASITTGQTFYADTDNDGFGDSANSTTACTAPAGYVSNNSDNCPSDMNKQNPGTCGCGVADTDSDADGVADCNDICALGDDNDDLDTDGIPDACDNDIDGDGVDNASDCDPMNASITTGTIYYVDADGDAYGDENDAGTPFCSNPGAGYSTNNLDCDDGNSGKNPGATEIPGNGIDEDCDGSDAIVDSDGDGITDASDNCPAIANPGQEDDDADGVGNVCDICLAGDDNIDMDTDGTPDACDTDRDGDGVDNASDCDPDNSSVGAGTIYYVDADGDTYGDENDAGAAFCSNPGAGYSTNNLDCDDANSGKNPGATEIPGNGIDEDCDGSDAIVDSDGDGITDASDNCPAIANAGQEDDDADGVGNVCDICLAGDDNADMDNDGTPDACDTDADGDGISNSTDCDDTNASIGAGTIWYQDTDGDGIGVASSTLTACTQPAGYVSVSGDQCPTDGNKTTPGTCGCGQVEGTCGMTVKIEANDLTICPDNSVSFTAVVTNMEPGTVFNWDFGTGASPQQKTGPSATNVVYSQEGDFTVTLTVTSPTQTIVEQVIVSAKRTTPVKPEFVGTLYVPCGQTTQTFAVQNNPGYTYNWSFENGTIVSGQTTSSVQVMFDPAQSSTELMKVSAYDEYGCEVVSNTVNMSACNATGVQDLEELENIKIYPNPFTNQLFIQNDSYKISSYEITLTDLTGVKVFTDKFTSNGKVTIDTETLKAGVYIVSVLAEEQVYTTKLIKVQ